MKNSLLVALPLIIFLSFGFIGCGGTGEGQKTETQPSALEVMQKDMTALQTTNDSLKYQITRIEQEKNALAAHAADLETQVNDLKAKFAALTPPPKPVPVVSDTRESYHQALEEFRQRQYSNAADLFQKILEIGAPPHLDDNCVYWIGECLYGQKKYTEAISQFEKVFDFKWSEKKDDSQIMIANSYLAKGDKEKGKEELQDLIKKFPASPFVPLAKTKLNKL